jgi:hypothetical protein
MIVYGLGMWRRISDLEYQEQSEKVSLCFLYNVANEDTCRLILINTDHIFVLQYMIEPDSLPSGMLCGSTPNHSCGVLA